MRRVWKRVHLNNKGIGIVEIILILVILIALVIIFRSQITELVNRALAKITADGGTIIGNGN